MSFGRFPNKWVIERGLRSFPAGVRPGENLAALKVYLLIAAYADYYTWTAALSFSEIEEISHLSRPMVSSAIKNLVERELIAKTRIKHSNAYQIVDDNVTWAKVPQDRIRVALKYFPNRGRVGLAAVKIYMLLLAMRNNNTCSFSISYEKIHGYTKVRLADIRMALSILIAGGFINIKPSLYSELDNHTHNEYVMLGDFDGKRPRHRRPHKEIEIRDDHKDVEHHLVSEESNVDPIGGQE